MKDFDIDYNQFRNLSCYEEFEIQCTLAGISKINVLKEIGHEINNYYFFVSDDGIFNWFDLEGNHVKDPGVLNKIREIYIPKNIARCIIPNSVTSIGNNAFFCCNFLKEVTIPDNLKIIGEYAFSYCDVLTSINIPDSITSISNWAFSYCESLKEITIPDNVKNINDFIFYDCKSLKKVTIPYNVTYIGDYAFSCCASLTSVIIPNNVKSIGNRVFWSCNSLKEIIFKGKTLEEVKQMSYYPFGIRDNIIIKCEK